MSHLRVLVVHLWRLDDNYQLNYLDWLFVLVLPPPWSLNRTLETFIIRVQYPNEFVKLLKQDWELIFNSLFNNVFPSLKTLTILITADEGRDPTRWCDWFNKSANVRKLRSERNINVEVLVKTDLGELLPVDPLK